MAYTWRTDLPKAIGDIYIQTEQEWFDIVVSASGNLNVTIVSNQFVNIPLLQRREQFEQFLVQFKIPLSTGFLSLYTIEEANTLELSKPSSNPNTPVYSWYDLAQQAANLSETPQVSKKELRIPRTIAFYSFKGGVGRTTALAHVAAILAMQGRKVVAVDLDLEAPGLSSALNLTPLPEYGIVDYFYERSYLRKDVDPGISVAEIFGEVLIPNASGRLFVVSAGKLDISYIAKGDDLRANAITERGEDLWSTFYQEITEQLQPDIILVDSRTGFNEWGAFSLLRAADKAIIFLYPNEQNSSGVRLITNALAQRVSCYFVFSLVPAVKDAGLAMVQEQWKNIKKEDYYDEVYYDDPRLKDEIELDNLLVIPYLTAIALAKSYPVQELLSYYQPIADIVDEDVNAIYMRDVLTNQNLRLELLNSLTFPKLNVEDKNSIYQHFLRTANFDKLLDANTSLILGHKGTGKSALYNLFLKHRGDAADFAYGRLSKVICVPGYEALQPHITVNMMRSINETLEQNGRTWEEFWRLLLLLHIYLNNRLSVPKNNSLHELLTQLKQLLQNSSDWSEKHTNILVTMLTLANSGAVAQEAITTLNTSLQQEERIVWVLYDDFYQNIPGEIRERAIRGLFRLVQNSARSLKNIKFKIFLSEDIWESLSLDKKYFNGRSLILSWTHIDFLRLALQQTLFSKSFKSITDNFSPIKYTHQANEEDLNNALQLLWGSRGDLYTQSEYISHWLYRSLTDASGTTFPKLINTLLKRATEVELQAAKKGHRLPVDRLLSPTSLEEGLLAAAQERCDDLRQAYPQFRPFFDALAKKGTWLKAEELQSLWHDTVLNTTSELKDFTQFVNYLRSLGVVGIYEELEGSVIYSFAEIYVKGFRMDEHPF